MKFIVLVGEGKKRLRLLISAMAAIIVYIYLFFDDYRVHFLEGFIQYPLVSLLFFFVFYIVTSLVYWVLDGFEKDHGINNKFELLTGLELFELAHEFSMEFHKILISISGSILTGDENIDKVLVKVKEGWQEPALAYSFGLTCICMLKMDKTFMQKKLAKDFAEKVSIGIGLLAESSAMDFGDKKWDAKESKEYSDAQVNKIIQLVLMQIKSKGKFELLELLNGYVADLIGFREPIHNKKLNEAGMALLDKLNEKLFSLSLAKDITKIL